VACFDFLFIQFLLCRTYAEHTAGRMLLCSPLTYLWYLPVLGGMTLKRKSLDLVFAKDLKFQHLIEGFLFHTNSLELNLISWPFLTLLSHPGYQHFERYEKGKIFRVDSHTIDIQGFNICSDITQKYDILESVQRLIPRWYPADTRVKFVIPAQHWYLPHN